jgi:prefoldin subunit 5
LLLLTILYCVRLNKQLRLLKADEQSLRATISELITATEIADRAIAGLKSTMQEGEQTLRVRLERGEQLAAELDLHVNAGNQLLARLARIVAVARPAGEPTSVQDAKAVAAAAQAFADRTRTRLSGQAA